MSVPHARRNSEASEFDSNIDLNLQQDPLPQDESPSLPF